ncbi:uncharacterized protein VDAG_09338 [Verticillium dahliae VdLs.17]|uniref:Uncharacterized protein n=1 Tax=Verticillium dahliae (strain VdLs.17 / ATCC MYA-4575 / FGSC 10137) TaxID=498257 RepID=G2XGQ6_VERDV|nr:uncharacterized protein VDAG_09338 [Verticillium dahliae VdLs.17]EGY19004.1 hypothetical protein VDAG_09338 [Verticillium dahliae VdLs.17]
MDVTPAASIGGRGQPLVAIDPVLVSGRQCCDIQLRSTVHWACGGEATRYPTSAFNSYKM